MPNEIELTFHSCNTQAYPKRITTWITFPDEHNSDTGLLHIAHGWGGNRFQYREMQRHFSATYNLVCVATEYRQSGFDFDPVSGLGAYLPYDASHYQVIDCLNAVRTVLATYPWINRRRIMAFGGSQGGHVTMLMTAFAPRTFALAISGSALTHMDSLRIAWTGRQMSPDEIAIRDAVALAPRADCPVVLMHGTADETVDVAHTRLLEAALDTGTRLLRTRYIEGGGHSLAPVTTRQQCTIEMADDLLRDARNPNPDDFFNHTRVEIPCVTQTCVIDWGKESADWELVRWRA